VKSGGISIANTISPCFTWRLQRRLAAFTKARRKRIGQTQAQEKKKRGLKPHRDFSYTFSDNS
jgi:hypothetical protein